MRDDDFNTDIGIVNLHPYKGTHWVCYIGRYYFDSVMVVLLQKILKII